MRTEHRIPPRTGDPATSTDPATGSKYLRFGAMIATSMVAMYVLTYVNTFEIAHVRWSETRFYMTLLMGATMAVIMLGFMHKMHSNRKINAAIVAGSMALFALATFLVRSQATVEDASYMNAMIPHHSIAILTSDRAEISDVRVCELARDIAMAQRREIAEMKWLVADIAEHGPAETAADALQRPVPPYEGRSIRRCAGE